MSYQVIARKYRPQRFADVVGQEHVTRTLSNAVEQNRIAHGYIFVGPRGTGKTTIARIFAKCLNCTDGPKVDFPDTDPRCIEITEGRSIDVMEIDGASNNGVEQVRELRETVKYSPAAGKFKIYIIDEVHMLSSAAFNALLKTLEEPPAHVKFLFATTEPEKVLPTILSRCQRFDLRRIPAALITKHLAHIAQLENVQIDAAALDAIARGADGGMRDAESTLDQLISFCGDKIEEGDVLAMFGLTSRTRLIELARAVLDGQPEAALRELNDLARQGKDLGRLVGDLLNHFRNLLIYAVSKGDLDLLEVAELEAAALKEQSQGVTAEALTRVMEALSDAEIRLRESASKKIAVEVSLLKAIQARNSVSLDGVLQQLQALRSGAPAPSPVSVPAPAPFAPRVAAPVPAPAPSYRPAPAPAAPLAETPVTVPADEAPAPAPATAAGGEGTGMEPLWRQLLEAVGRASPFTRTYLLEAHPVSLTPKLFTIGFDPEFEDHIGLVDNPRNQTLLQTKMTELGHPGLHIKFIKADRNAGWQSAPTPAPAFEPAPAPRPAPAAGAAPAPATRPAASAAPPASAAAAPRAAAPAERTSSVPFNKDDFKDDPLIQKALEIFKGQIIDVRN